MTRFKTLGVALFAVLALIAVSASAASATNYTASTYPTTMTAESVLGNDKFGSEAGIMECASHFQGTLNGSSSSLTVAPKYASCKAFGFISFTYNMGSCDYLFTTPTSVSADNWVATTDIKCTNPAEPITVSGYTCKYTIGEQSPGGSISISNNTAAGDLLLKANVTGIKFTVTQDGFGCPFSSTGPKENMTYSQHSPITFDSTNGAKIDVG